jgi:hypothetical protein
MNWKVRSLGNEPPVPPKSALGAMASAVAPFLCPA